MDSRVTATEEEQAPWLLRQGHMLQMVLEPEVCGQQHDNIARQQAGYYYVYQTSAPFFEMPQT